MAVAEVAGHVEGRDLVEHCRDHVRQAQRTGNAGSDLDDREPDSAADDEPEHVTALRANRHAQPDFLRALADGVGNHTIETNGGERAR